MVLKCGKTVLEQLAEKAANKLAKKEAIRNGQEELYAVDVTKKRLKDRRLSNKLNNNRRLLSSNNSAAGLPSIHLAEEVDNNIKTSSYINIDAANYEVS